MLDGFSPFFSHVSNEQRTFDNCKTCSWRPISVWLEATSDILRLGRVTDVRRSL